MTHEEAGEIVTALMVGCTVHFSSAAAGTVVTPPDDDGQAGNQGV